MCGTPTSSCSSTCRTPKRRASRKDIAITSLAPAFMLSELKRAFEIGFLIFVPFLIIDMAVASILMSMGMMMLPPVIISLPFKLIFFVLVDGWRLISGSLVESYHALARRRRSFEQTSPSVTPLRGAPSWLPLHRSRPAQIVGERVPRHAKMGEARLLGVRHGKVGQGVVEHERLVLAGGEGLGLVAASRLDGDDAANAVREPAQRIAAARGDKSERQGLAHGEFMGNAGCSASEWDDDMAHGLIRIRRPGSRSAVHTL